VDGLFVHTRRGGSDRSGLEDQLRLGESREQQQLSLYTGSDRIYYQLSGMLRRESDAQAKERIVAFARLFREQEGLESFTFDIFAQHPSHAWSIDELERMAAFHKEHPTWWSQVVEAPLEFLTESKRNSIKDEDLKNAFDVTVGVTKGVYAFGKGAVEGLYGLAEYAIRFGTHAETRAHALGLVKEWAYFCMVMQFGTAEAKKKSLDKIQALGQVLVNSVKDHFIKEWEKAEKENKTDELIAKWGTQGLIELATLVLALLKGIRAAKAIKETEKAASELSQTAGKLNKTVGGKKVVAEVLTDAPGAAAKVEPEAARASIAWRELEEKKSLMERTREARRYAKNVSKGELKQFYRLLSHESAQKLQGLSPKTREQIERSLYYLSTSDTFRDGRVRSGAQFLVEHRQKIPSFIEEAAKVLKDIQDGKAIEMYTTVPKNYAASSRHYEYGAKGAAYHDFIRGNGGAGNRFGPGKYLATNEKTSLSEVFLGRLRPDGSVQGAGREYAVLKVSFKPTFKNNNFLVYPSFANPGGGVCIVDLEHMDWLATETVEVVRILKEVP